MKTRIQAFITADPHQRAHMLAKRLHQKLQKMGARQVRFYDGMFLTYPYPAPRGYGTRGLLIGIYNATVQLEWIEEDLARVFTGESP